MDANQVARIRANPLFRELEQKRNVFSWTLSVIMLTVYYGFILLVAFGKGLVATPFIGVVTWAFPLGLFVIACAIGLTGLYVLRANSEFDDLTRKVVNDHDILEAAR